MFTQQNKKMIQSHFKDTWLEQMKIKKQKDIIDKEFEKNAPVGSPLDFMKKKVLYETTQPDQQSNA